MEMDHVKDMRLKGVGKFFHSLLMFITYPFRHIFKFLAFLLVVGVILAAIPMYYGVDCREIGNWYLSFLHKAEDKAIKVMPIEITKPLEPELKEVSAPRVIRKRADKQIRERVFKRPFVKLPEKEKANRIARIEAVKVPEQKSQEAQYYKKDNNLPLVYEENPKTVDGKTIVFTANEMAVGDAYVILYGVYSNPSKSEHAGALEYMRQLVEGKEISCKIVAYTYQNIATGVCFLDGRSINQNLVDAGLADNVAL